MKRAYDVNVSGGGPVVRDKLWFFTSGRVQQNQNYVAGTAFNTNAGNPNAWTYVPDRSERVVFFVTQKSRQRPRHVAGEPEEQVQLLLREPGPHLGRQPDQRVTRGGHAVPLPEEPDRHRRVVVADQQPAAARGAVLASRRGVLNIYPPEGDVYRQLIPVTEQSTGVLYRGSGQANAGQSYGRRSRRTSVKRRLDVLRDRRPRLQGRLRRLPGHRDQHASRQRLRPELPVQQRRAEPDHRARDAVVHQALAEGDRLLRPGQVDGEPPDGQRGRAARLLQRGVPGTPPRPRNPGADPRSRAAGDAGDELQGPHAAAGRLVRPVRHREDGAQGRHRAIRPRDRADHGQPGLQSRDHGHPVVDRRRPRLRARLRHPEPADQRRVRPDVGPQFRAAEAEHRVRSRDARRLGRAAQTTGSSRPASSTS